MGDRVDLLVTDAAELLTCARDAADRIGRIPGGGVAVRDGRIVAVGDVSGFSADTEISAQGCVVLPGFVDSHTHVVFGGDRADEYAALAAGLPVPAGASRGITGTMAETRNSSSEALADQSRPRLRQLLGNGITTVESKTGYGLSAPAEWRMLEANALLAEDPGPRIVSTYLGGHAIAPGRDADRWTAEIVAQLPAVAAAGLATFNDVYCDTGYFSLAQSRRILTAGAEAGLSTKIHLDAYSHTDAARLAVEFEAVSADHLNHTTDAELAELAEAGVCGVYLPALEFAVSHPAPLDPLRVLEAGMELALATDICPGCWTTSMETVIAMACRLGRLPVAEAIRAATLGGAIAVGLDHEIGSLVPGLRADLLVLDIPGHEHLAYRLSGGNVQTVLKDGQIVRTRPQENNQ